MNETGRDITFLLSPPSFSQQSERLFKETSVVSGQANPFSVWIEWVWLRVSARVSISVLSLLPLYHCAEDTWHRLRKFHTSLWGGRGEAGAQEWAEENSGGGERSSVDCIRMESMTYSLSWFPLCYTHSSTELVWQSTVAQISIEAIQVEIYRQIFCFKCFAALHCNIYSHTEDFFWQWIYSLHPTPPLFTLYSVTKWDSNFFCQRSTQNTLVKVEEKVYIFLKIIHLIYLVKISIHPPESIHVRITLGSDYSCESSWLHLIRALPTCTVQYLPIILLKNLQALSRCWGSCLDNNFQVLP